VAVEPEKLTVAFATGRPVTEFTSRPEINPCVVCPVSVAAQIPSRTGMVVRLNCPTVVS
jgi:hypothetical protein